MKNKKNNLVKKRKLKKIINTKKTIKKTIKKKIKKTIRSKIKKTIRSKVKKNIRNKKKIFKSKKIIIKKKRP
jgi:hypothetical protein